MSSFTSEFAHGGQLEAEQREKAQEQAAIRQAKIAQARADAASRNVAASTARTVSGRSQAIAQSQFQNAQAQPSEAVREQAAQAAQAAQSRLAASPPHPESPSVYRGSYTPVGTAARLESAPQFQYSVTVGGLTKSFDTQDEAQQYINRVNRDNFNSPLGKGQGVGEQTYTVTANGVTKNFRSAADAQSYIDKLNEQTAEQNQLSNFALNRGTLDAGQPISPTDLATIQTENNPNGGFYIGHGARSPSKKSTVQDEDDKAIESIGNYFDDLGNEVEKAFSSTPSSQYTGRAPSSLFTNAPESTPVPGTRGKQTIAQVKTQVVETPFDYVGDFFKRSSEGYESVSRKNLQSKDYPTRFVGGLESVGEGFTGSFATLFGRPNVKEDRNVGTDVGELLGTGATVFVTGGVGEIAGVTDVAAVAKGAAFGGAINVGLEELFGVPRNVPVTSSRVTRDKFGNETQTETTDYEQISASPGFDDVLSAFQSGADIGALGSVAGAGIAKGLGSIPKVGSKIVSTLASKGAKGFAAKSAFGGGVNALFTLPFSTNPKDIAENALIGAGFAGPGERLGSAVRGQIEPLLPGGPEVAAKGGVTEGKNSEIPFYETKPLSKLGGKTVRVIPDVTENPATGFEQTGEYGGRKISTAHATLTPEYFDLRSGKSTILRGQGIQQLVEETAGKYGLSADDVSIVKGKNGTTNLRLPGGRQVPLITKGGGIAGYRQTRQIFPFYSAPGSEESVNIYGGYAGIGSGEESGRIVFGPKAKPTALITDETYIENIRKGAGESEQDFINRYLSRRGKTSVGLEDLLGTKQAPISTERQVETTTQYERFGKQLPGSKFVSKGKIGTVQVRESPDSLFTERIPGLRNIEKAARTRYTNLNLYRGTFEETTDEDLMQRIAQNDFLDVSEYNAQRDESVGSVSSSRITSGLQSLVPQSLSRGRSSLGSSSRSSPTSLSDSLYPSVGSSGSPSSRASKGSKSASISKSRASKSASASSSRSQASASASRSNSSAASASRSKSKSKSSSISASKKTDDDSFPRIRTGSFSIKKRKSLKRKELSNPVDVFEVLGL